MSVETAVEPEQIVKNLRKVWADLGKEEANGVLRACSMTMITVVKESQDAAAVGETLAALMHEHPSRAIVLRVREEGGPSLDARVFAQCWMPFGRRQQICCEQIELTSSRASLEDVPAVLRALIVPDLPVVLYCPDWDLCRSKEFQQLLPLTGKLIIDSGSCEDAEVVKYLNDLPKLAFRKADLAWARLTRWRQAIAHIFNDSANQKAIYELTDVNILYAGRQSPAAVHYLAAWFMHVLGAGVHLNVAAGVGPSCGAIERVDLHGPGFEATIDLIDKTSVEVRVNGFEQKVVFPEMTEYEALRQELAIVGRDPVFEDVLGLANLLRGEQ
ncbi:MAG: glucose-6-phosphate dehydrogenase assembly protein OpcA [Bryobacteraceae bacterium]